MKHLSDAQLVDRLLALPTNIRQGWQYLPETNTLAYYENQQITNKFFYNIGPREILLKGKAQYI